MITFTHNVSTQQTQLRQEQPVVDGVPQVSGAITPTRFEVIPGQHRTREVHVALPDRVLRTAAKIQGNLWAAGQLSRRFEEQGMEEYRWKSRVLERAFTHQLQTLGEHHGGAMILGEGRIPLHFERNVQEGVRLLEVLKAQVSQQEFQKWENLLRQLREGRERAFDPPEPQREMSVSSD